ncbi:MAG: flagellar basal body-associated FliL family protein [Ignavibacteriales bacterium]|nr:flagellar basal body-associated FliL family protein [Ignavibacteriales bacterium]
MAKDTPALDPKAPQPAPAAPPAKEGLSMKKILMFGGPIILVQIVVIYFLVTKFLAPSPAQGGQEVVAAEHDEKKGEGGEQTTQIVVIKDVIVNPAGTNGNRLLVTTVGIEVLTAEAKTELEQKEVQTRDVLVTILTGKRLEELAAPEQRDALREEIGKSVSKLLRSGKLKNVYISKFIIQ